MVDAELETFKTLVDLRVYAAGQGYELDRKDSWRGSAVMRHGNGDKIIIKRDTDNHYVYFSVRDDNDNGSIIDFVQNRMGISLGTVRKELRPWIGMPAERLPVFPDLLKTSKDRTKVEREYLRMEVVMRHPYLEGERAIPAALLQSDRFAGCIRTDSRGNAAFPHYDEHGLCGFELKNYGFTGFASGGEKGLWATNDFDDDNRIVLVEAGIEGASYPLVYPDPHTRLRSIGGELNPRQPELIRVAIACMRPGSEVVSAMNADANGRKLAAVVRQAVELVGRDDLRFTLQEPFGFKDWNDQWRGRPSPPLFLLPAPLRWRLSDKVTVQPEDTTFEKHYRIGQLARMWGYGRETIRKLVKDDPGVLKARMGRKKAHTSYSVPESAARRIHTRLLNGG